MELSMTMVGPVGTGSGLAAEADGPGASGSAAGGEVCAGAQIVPRTSERARMLRRICVGRKRGTRDRLFGLAVSGKSHEAAPPPPTG